MLNIEKLILFRTSVVVVMKHVNIEPHPKMTTGSFYHPEPECEINLGLGNLLDDCGNFLSIVLYNRVFQL